MSLSLQIHLFPSNAAMVMLPSPTAVITSPFVSCSGNIERICMKCLTLSSLFGLVR